MRRPSAPLAAVSLAGLLVLAAGSCAPEDRHRPGSLASNEPAAVPSPASPAPNSAKRELMLATTTSLDATGLLDLVAEEFGKDSGIGLKWIAVGTGAALRQARDGNVDAVLVHARKQEEEFLREGFGVNRRVIARNFFLLVGPENDPAGIAGSRDVGEAMARIKAGRAPFVSRGDNSGTHAREIGLWAIAGGRPEKNYLETGQGMAQTLLIAAERRGYCLTDSATFFGTEGLRGLRPVFRGSPELENVYAVIAVNPFRFPSARYGEAMAFIAFLTSLRGQRLIADFEGKGPEPLFEAIAGRPGVETEQ